jgi:hypothetical protein
MSLLLLIFIILTFFLIPCFICDKKAQCHKYNNGRCYNNCFNCFI